MEGFHPFRKGCQPYPRTCSKALDFPHIPQKVCNLQGINHFENEGHVLKPPFDTQAFDSFSWALEYFCLAGTPRERRRALSQKPHFSPKAMVFARTPHDLSRGPSIFLRFKRNLGDWFWLVLEFRLAKTEGLLSSGGLGLESDKGGEGDGSKFCKEPFPP